MKFILIDSISELEPGKRIVAHKALSLAEEYLADHFPTFPVLPGVLMLEAMVQAAAWVVRTGLDFRPSLVVLQSARNVTYKSFLAPGKVLDITCECREITEQKSVFSAAGRVGDREIVKARITLAHRSLAESNPSMADVDERIRSRMRSRLDLLQVGGPAQAAVSCV